MCTLRHGPTDLVAHMMNSMNKVLRDYILEITMPFLDGIPIKRCVVEDKDNTIDDRGWWKFSINHNEAMKKLKEIGTDGSNEKNSKKHYK